MDREYLVTYAIMDNAPTGASRTRHGTYKLCLPMELGEAAKELNRLGFFDDAQGRNWWVMPGAILNVKEIVKK